jgi:hypothetical protein
MLACSSAPDPRVAWYGRRGRAWMLSVQAYSSWLAGGLTTSFAARSLSTAGRTDCLFQLAPSWVQAGIRKGTVICCNNYFCNTTGAKAASQLVNTLASAHVTAGAGKMEKSGDVAAASAQQVQAPNIPSHHVHNPTWFGPRFTNPWGNWQPKRCVLVWAALFSAGILSVQLELTGQSSES